MFAADLIDRKINVIRSFRKNKDAIVIGHIRELEDLVLFMNQSQMEKSGIDSEGNEINPGYTEFTIKIKMEKGQPFDKVTLKDTGDFHNSLYIRYAKGEFEIMSDDPKADKLMEKYGEEILGLINENLQDIIDTIKTEMLKDLKSLL